MTGITCKRCLKVGSWRRLRKSQILRPQRRSRRLLGRGATAVAHSGGGEPQRRNAGAESGRPAVSAQHAEAHADRSRRTLPARDPGQSGGSAGVDCERCDGPGRAGRRAQGQHGSDLRGRLHPAAAAGHFCGAIPAFAPTGSSKAGRSNSLPRGSMRRSAAASSWRPASSHARSRRCTLSRSRRRPT